MTIPTRAAAALFLAFAAVSGTATPAEPARLGHPPAFALVLEQFPLGMEGEQFPFPDLQVLAERHLRDAGLPLVPRTVKQEPPFLRISVVGIRLKTGYVYLLEGDLREVVPASCAGGQPVEVSTWQHRRWITAQEGGVPSPEQAWGALQETLRAFGRAYGANK